MPLQTRDVFKDNYMHAHTVDTRPFSPPLTKGLDMRHACPPLTGTKYIMCVHHIFAEIMYEVMISYKWKDSEDFAIELEQYLQRNNKRVYRDASRNKGGQVIPEQWQ